MNGVVDFEVFVLFGNDLFVFFFDMDVDWVVEFECSMQVLVQLDFVGWCEYCYVGQYLYDCQVFVGMMGWFQFGIGQFGVGFDDDYWDVVIVGIYVDLFEVVCGGEWCDGVDYWL